MILSLIRATSPCRTSLSHTAATTVRLQSRLIVAATRHAGEQTGAQKKLPLRRGSLSMNVMLFSDLGGRASKRRKVIKANSSASSKVTSVADTTASAQPALRRAFPHIEGSYPFVVYLPGMFVKAFGGRQPIELPILQSSSHCLAQAYRPMEA